jgi:hypothetical protein
LREGWTERERREGWKEEERGDERKKNGKTERES